MVKLIKRAAAAVTVAGALAVAVPTVADAAPVKPAGLTWNAATVRPDCGLTWTCAVKVSPNGLTWTAS